MTYEEKWKRISEISDRMKAIYAELEDLDRENSRLLMTQIPPPINTPASGSPSE